MTITSRIRPALNKLPVKMVPATVAVAIAVVLSGCSYDEIARKEPNFDLIEPSQRHPIMVSQQPTRLSVNVPRGSSGLSPKERADILDFVQHFHASDAGDSRLVILAPSGSGNEIAAMQAVQQIRAMLADYGFSDSLISVEAYQADKRAEAPVKVSYMRYVAEGPECGHWTENVAYTPNNLPMPNLGCASQKNLAAMIANPADLIAPRTMTPHSGERRDVVWDKYQKGDTTDSRKSQDATVTTQGN